MEGRKEMGKEKGEGKDKGKERELGREVLWSPQILKIDPDERLYEK